MGNWGKEGQFQSLYPEHSNSLIRDVYDDGIRNDDLLFVSQTLWPVSYHN